MSTNLFLFKLRQGRHVAKGVRQKVDLIVVEKEIPVTLCPDGATKTSGCDVVHLFW